MKREKLDLYSKLVVCAIGALVFGYIFIRHVLVLLLPFLIAWFVAFAVRPVSRKLAARLRASERVVRLVLALFFSLTVLTLLFLFIWRLLVQGWRILTAVSERSEMTSLLERLMNPESILSRVLPDGVAEALSHAADGMLEGLVSAFADAATGFVGAIPHVFLFIIITLIANIYFSLDLERINSFVRSKLPTGIFSSLVRFKNGFFTVGVKYVRAYLTVMLIVFSLTFLGLLLLGVDYAFLIGVVVAVLDVLPAIGIGTVLVPWGVFEIFFGSRSLGIGLIVLFLIVEFVRQLAEPKIVGRHLGLHPVVSLILLWSAYSLLGMLGIITVPIAVVVINSLFGKNDPPKIEKGPVKETDGT